MRTATLVAKNTVIQAVGRILSLGFSVLIIMMVTRYLGTLQFGYYTTVNAYLFFFAAFAEFGLYILISRELPLVENHDAYLSSIFSVKLVGSALCFALGTLIIFLFPYPMQIKLGVVIASLGFFASSFISLFSAYFQFLLKTQHVALADIVNKISILIVAGACVFWNLGLMFVIGAFALGMIIQSLFLYSRFKRHIKLHFVWDRKQIKSIFEKSWPIMIGGLLVLFYFRVDTLILSFFHPAQTVGLYGAAYRFLEVLISFPGLFIGLLLPILSSCFERGDADRFASVWQNALNVLMIAVWPMIFFTMAAAPDILLYLAGPEFVPATPLLRLLIIATGLIFLSHLTSYTIVAMNMQKSMIKHYAIAASGALVLYLLLIPPFAGIGGALGTIAVECYILCSTFILARNAHRFPVSLKSTATAAFCGLLGFCVFILLRPISIMAAAPAFFITYIGVGFLFNLFDIKLIKELFMNKT